MPDGLAPLLGFLGLFALVAWIAYVANESNRRSRRLKAVSEFQTRLLDRIGSAKEFGDILQSEGGVRLLESLSLEEPAPTHARIVRSTQVGVVLLALGVGLLLLHLAFPNDAGFVVTGALALSLGIGFLLSSLLAYRLSRSLGLLDQRPPMTPAAQSRV